MPNIGIVCMGSTEMGGYQAESTVSLSDTLPGGSYRQGTLNLLLPPDSRTGTPVPACATPAYVQAIPYVSGSSTKPVGVQIPEATVASLNQRDTPEVVTKKCRKRVSEGPFRLGELRSRSKESEQVPMLVIERQ